MRDHCYICGNEIHAPMPHGCPEEWEGMCIMCVIAQEILPYTSGQLMAYIHHIMGCRNEHEIVICIVQLRDMVKLSRPLVRNNPLLS